MKLVQRANPTSAYQQKKPHAGFLLTPPTPVSVDLPAPPSLLWTTHSIGYHCTAGPVHPLLPLGILSFLQFLVALAVCVHPGILMLS